MVSGRSERGCVHTSFRYVRSLAQLGTWPCVSCAGCSGALALAVVMLTLLLHAAQPSALRARTCTSYATPGEKQLCCSLTHASADGKVAFSVAPHRPDPLIGS